MPQLEMNHDEWDVLRNVLESYLGDLRTEIAGTESHDFRQRLKQQESVLKGLIARLSDARE
jgi:hypothetical protein